ncbi:MAG: hypothetical protein ACK53Y_01750, partial [bacterium]
MARGFQLYIDDGTLIPGWYTKMYFLQSGHQSLGQVRYVSSAGLLSSCAPESATKAFHLSNPDRSIWMDSYNEKFDGLCN